MNKGQRSRLEALEAAAVANAERPLTAAEFFAEIEEGARQTEAFFAGHGPYPADPPCPPGEDPDLWDRIQRDGRIRDLRRLEMRGHEARGAEIFIDPPPTEEELHHADVMNEAIRHGVLRTLYEKQRDLEQTTTLSFIDWIADQGLPPLTD